MNFSNISNSFTDEEKRKSFEYLQHFMFDNNKPFFIGRLSGNEANICGKLLYNKNISQNLLYEMLTAAGIQFLNNDDVKNYVDMYIKSCQNSSLLAVWSGGMYIQAKEYYTFLDNRFPNQKRICAQALEPFYFMQEPEYKFNKYFINKKVLIISSHKHTIESQLSKHTSIYEKPIFDESTEFYVYKPPQQNCGNHDSNSWQYHYDIMKNNISRICEEFDFDIALVSCGGFGMIISDYIYSDLKKNVMYIGGGLQLFFGIKGNRWINHPKISKLMNDKWCSVMNEDKPSTLSNNPRVCENNCYW